MNRDNQFVALGSMTQGIDAMCASILLLDPQIAGVDPELIKYAEGLSWEISGVKQAIHATTFTRAVIASGIVYIRALANLMGVTSEYDKERSTYRLSTLEPPRDKSPNTGFDMHWTQIPKASGLSLNLIKAFAGEGIAVKDNDGIEIAFHDVYLASLKYSDKAIVHLTNDGKWSSILHGQLISSGLFTIVAVRELLLYPVWSRDKIETVVYPSKFMLPQPLLHFLTATLDEYGAAWQAVAELKST